MQETGNLKNICFGIRNCPAFSAEETLLLSSISL
jgi:hypothetical protein